MQILNLEPPGRRAPGARFALFALGFRPFFLLAGLYGVAIMGLWLYSFVAGRPFETYYGVYAWHAHGMLFGYTVAVIAGFLLTAVRNWTQIQTLSGAPLAALAALWLAGRLAPFFPQLIPPAVNAVVDLSFLPVLAASLAIPLWRSGQRHNLIFVPMLAALTLADLMVHLQVLGYTGLTAARGNGLAIDIIVLLIVVMGGRVIPFFTERALGVAVRRWPWVDRVGIASVVLLALADLLYPEPVLIGVLATLAALSHGLRLAGWHHPGLWSVPLLWVLHLGYGWLVVGFALKAALAAGWVAPVLAWHAFTAGGIGGLTLGMMARVSLGHTGRSLQPAGVMAAAFALVNLAALVRVVAPILSPQPYVDWIAGSGALWIAAFAIFVAVYAPLLIRPRIDGRPG
jgi:uncharacterized protein involved in response to NO